MSAIAERGGGDGRTAQAVGLALQAKIPAGKLRCIHGTLDEQRDFDLRCAEVAIIKAEHDLQAARIARTRILDGEEAARTLYDENLLRWFTYRDRLLEMAQTPARSAVRLSRKKELIGKFWLRCEGEWYDQLRAGVAADEAWLAENAPKKRGRG